MTICDLTSSKSDMKSCFVLLYPVFGTELEASRSQQRFNTREIHTPQEQKAVFAVLAGFDTWNFAR